MPIARASSSIMRLDDERALHGAGRAIGAVAGLVGEHLVAAQVEVRHLVVAAHEQQRDAERRAGVGARVEHDAALRAP